MPRQEFAGAAVATELGSGISAVATSFTIVNATGWPSGGATPFVVTIDRGGPNEEKILCTSRAGTTVNVTTRGYDGTTGKVHSAGESVEHTISAVVIDELNDHVNTTARDDHTQYLNNTRHQTAVHTVDQPAQAHVLVSAKHTASGLTTGHVLRATGATTFAFGAIQDGDVPATIARKAEAILQSLAVAKGDLVVASAVGAWSRLAVGSDGQFLRGQSAAGVGLAWETIVVPTVKVLTAAQNNNTTALQDIPELQFAVLNGEKWLFEYVLFWDPAATTTGISVNYTGPAVTTGLTRSMASPTFTSVIMSTSATASDQLDTTESPSTVDPGIYWGSARGEFSAGGTVKLQFASEVAASNVQIMAGSYMVGYKLP